MQNARRFDAKKIKNHIHVDSKHLGGPTLLKYHPVVPPMPPLSLKWGPGILPPEKFWVLHCCSRVLETFDEKNVVSGEGFHRYSIC